MKITEQKLVDLGAEGALRIIAGSEAYNAIRKLPRVEYDARGVNQWYWRNVPVTKDTGAPVGSVVVVK